MKALTSSSCSKSIFESLASSSHRISEKPEFCFSLGFRNDQKGSNFWLHKLVHNQGLHPLLAVPSENQVDLEIEESQVQPSDQTNESKLVRVTFQLQKNCNFGEQFLLVGDDPMIGSWDPSEALPMTWSDGHVWTAELDLPTGKPILFKFILKGKGGDIIWQPGSDRVIQTWETMNKITVCEDWENAELQKITEEDQLPISNEEPEVVAEVSSFAEIVDSPQEEELDTNVSKMSDVEDNQTREEEKLLTESVPERITGDDNNTSSTEKPVTIIAENIGSLEDLTKSTSHKENERNTIPWNEELDDSPRNHDVGHNGNSESIENQEIEETPIMDGNFFDYQGDAVLVPGVTLPVDEEGSGEVQESTNTETSNGDFETQDQNVPEFSEEEESDDETPQETNATINNDKPDQLKNNNETEEKSHLTPEIIEDMSESQPDYGNPLQNDIQWGRETVKKFLTKLGFLL